MRRVIAAVVVLAMLAAQSDALRMNILASQFSGQNDASAGGAAIHKYPTRVTLGKKRITIYPVAVYTSRVGKFKYKVLRLSYPKRHRSIYVHVVDECARSSHDCRSNFRKAKKQGRELLDLHWTAWKPLNLKTYGLHKMKARVVGTLPRSKVKHVLTYEGKKNWVPKTWK
jgi:hypothetical protein